jgi:hypothetical protein
MNDNNTILSELDSIGVRVEGELCRYSHAGKEVSEPIAKAAQLFAMQAKHNKQYLIELWDELVKHLSVVPLSFYEASDPTQRMFINSIRLTNRYARRFPRFKNSINIIRRFLTMDSKNFSESYMSKIIEYAICFEWTYHIIKSDIYKSILLEKLAVKEVKASAQMGDVDLPMKARVQVDNEEADDDLEQGGRLHPMYTRKFRQYDMQHGLNSYDLEDRVYRLMNEPYGLNARDERQPNRTISRTV